MKNILLIAMALIGVIIAQAKTNPMTLSSGSVSELLDPSKTVLFKVDYSNVIVDNDNKKFTLPEYLEHRGPDFVADWDKDAEKAYTYLTIRFNHKNKKGAQAIASEGEYDILGTVYLSDIDFGNGAGAISHLAGFGGIKAGGCIISGKLVFTDKNNTEVAVLPFTEVKGMAHTSETVRLGLSYYELMNKLGDILKQEKKKK